MAQVKYKCPECGHNAQVGEESLHWDEATQQWMSGEKCPECVRQALAAATTQPQIPATLEAIVKWLQDSRTPVEMVYPSEVLVQWAKSTCVPTDIFTHEELAVWEETSVESAYEPFLRRFL